MSKNRILILGIFAFGVIFLLRAASGNEKFEYDSQGKRNPFIPLITSDGRLLKLDTEKKTEILAVQGIIYDGTGVSYAIVNNNVVKIGDMVESSQVLKIEEDKVSFIKDGKVTEIELKRGEE